MVITDLGIALITDQELRAARIDRDAFAWRVKMNFCPTMTRNGLCSKKCGNCQSLLQGALKNILPRARVPEAVVTWRLRGAAAIANENAVKVTKQKIVVRDEMGFKVENNTSFDKLAKRFGVT